MSPWTSRMSPSSKRTVGPADSSAPRSASGSRPIKLPCGHCSRPVGGAAAGESEDDTISILPDVDGGQEVSPPTALREWLLRYVLGVWGKNARRGHWGRRAGWP